MSDMCERQRRFQGFGPKAFRFLKDIRTHNDKAWFQAHRTDYERHLLEPLRDLVTNLADDLKAGFGLTAPLHHYLLDTLARVRPPK